MSSAEVNPILNPADRPRGSAASAPTRSISRAIENFKSFLGLRRRFEVDGVRYTERSSEPLHRAISRRGAGRKEFEVCFKDGTVQRIRCTPTRVYADISGPELLPCYQIAEQLLRPGMRVLDAATGTGYGAAWLVERVGPSGAVVALHRDRESIRYAQARYPADNAAFEIGWTEALVGEIDGAFDGVLACAALTPSDDAEAALTEWWRLVAPNGWLLVVAPVRRADARADESSASPELAVGQSRSTGSGATSDSPRVFAPDELSALITGTCAKPDESNAHAEGQTPTFRPLENRNNARSEPPVPAPNAEIATAEIVNYAAALVRKVVRA